MSKNNKFINSIKEIARRKQSENIEKAADQMTVQIYAAMAIALHRAYGFGYERINRVFLESQHIWEDFAGKADDMVKLCKEETGIDVMQKEVENEH